MDKLEIINNQDADFKRQIENLSFPIDYGIISIQVRAGKPTLVRLERTVKLD